ncbi:MAG: hypothetical protein JOZ81_07085 [Chloroflexi bacterium]|nr:hypothetical protein [Chloroflexota bacterium]MBV9547717.1 hypothetical protein [Chloroflexota bacterium]
MKPSLRSTLVPTMIGAAAVALVVGCQVTTPTSPRATRTVQIDASDFAFNAPETLTAGVATIHLTNQGQEAHHAQLLRLQDGMSFDQFTTALQQEGEGALALVSGEGGPGTVGPAGSMDVTLDLKPGTYVLACFIAGPDGVPHLMKGMLKPIEVTPSSEPAAAQPQAKSTFTMRDFSFDMPSTLKAGKATYKVVNQGPQMHELNILKLAPGKTAADALAWEEAPAGPPPFEAAGGMNAFSTSGSGYMTLDLQPGNYLAICNVPDPASGAAHSHLGMIKNFTVSE